MLKQLPKSLLYLLFVAALALLFLSYYWVLISRMAIVRLVLFLLAGGLYLVTANALRENRLVRLIVRVVAVFALGLLLYSIWLIIRFFQTDTSVLRALWNIGLVFLYAISTLVISALSLNG